MTLVGCIIRYCAIHFNIVFYATFIRNKRSTRILLAFDGEIKIIPNKMKKLLAVLTVITVLGCKSVMVNQTDSTNEINVTLDTWHKAAADANYNTYFNLMTDDAILLGLMQQKIGIKQHFRPMQNRILIKGKRGVLQL
jgi:hypothetical protein